MSKPMVCILIAVLFLALAVLACAQGITNQSPNGSPNQSSNGSDSCEAGGYLQISQDLVSHYTDQYGGSDCEYTIVIKNVHPAASIRLVTYVWNEDSTQGTQSGEWTAAGVLAPGQTYEWQARVYTSTGGGYGDADDVGQAVTIVDTITQIDGIIVSPGCDTKVFSDSFYSQYSYAVRNSLCQGAGGALALPLYASLFQVPYR